MRKVMLFIWLVIPICWACYHYGPGQVHLKKERSAKLIAKAEALEKSGKWLEAQELYEKALSVLPEKDSEKEKMYIKLKKARTYWNTAQIGEACTDLEALLEEAESSKNPDKKLINDIRAALAHSLYYTAWQMRLNGTPRKKWMKELEHARQNFRLLAENGGEKIVKRNLEAAIHLSRIDLNKLKGLKLPET